MKKGTLRKRKSKPHDSTEDSVFVELQRPSLREAVVENFHFGVITGVLKPGQRITERQICKMMGVSRTTAREAFQQLRSVGVLRDHRRKTFVGDELDASEIRDLYEFRGLCEGIAAKEARKNLKEDEIAKLREHVREMEWASRMKDLRAFRRADLDFHELIWHSNGKRYLFRVLKAVTEPYHFYFTALLRRATRKELHKMARLHRTQLENLSRLDGDKLSDRTEQHYRAVGAQFCRLYQKYMGSRGTGNGNAIQHNS